MQTPYRQPPPPIAPSGQLLAGSGDRLPAFQGGQTVGKLWDKPLQQCLHDKAAATVVVTVG